MSDVRVETNDFVVREQRFVRNSNTDPGRWFAVIEGVNPAPVSHPGDLITIDGKDYIVRSISYDTMNGYHMDLQDVDSILVEGHVPDEPTDPGSAAVLDWWDA